MNPSIRHQDCQRIFTWVVLGCLPLAVGYTSWVIRRADAGANQIQAGFQGTPLSIAGENALEAIQKKSHFLFINIEKPNIGKVNVAGLAPYSLRARRPHLPVSVFIMLQAMYFF